MSNILHTARFIATLGFASLGSASTFAAEQASGTQAQRAADAAQQIAMEADSAIRAIDPTTGEPSLIVDPSLPRPYGPADEEFVAITPELSPELGAADADVTVGTVASAASDTAPSEPPRGPATRMISRPVAQALPVAPAIANDDPFTLKSILTIPEGPFRYGDWYWDESNAPAKGKLIVTVDLDARVISAFRDGHEIGTAVALLGTKKHPTPLGSFPILTKEKDNISEKYNNAPMPWTLRLTWDGIAIHGSPVINGYASHGCIGVPDEFAQKLYAIAKRGDKVVITRGQMIGVGDKLS